MSVTRPLCASEQLKAVPCSLVVVDADEKARDGRGSEGGGAHSLTPPAELGVLVCQKLSGLAEEEFRVHMNCFRKGACEYCCRK